MDSPKIAIKDSSAARDSGSASWKYVEFARLDRRDHIVTLTTRFDVVDGKVDSMCQHGASYSYFVHINKKTGEADTIDNDLSLMGCDACKFIIRDLTDSFHLKSLLVQVITPAEDIYYTNSFVGLRNGEFEQLCSIDDTREEGIPLRREGATLTADIAGRDEVVENLEFDYPIQIDTKTFAVKRIRPEKQFLGWKTTATESFRAHRVIGGRVDSSLVAVEAGSEVSVDTLYRRLGKVRLRVQDSVTVEIKMETAKEKLGHNGAG